MNIALHRHFRWPALLAAVCAVVAANSWSQPPDPKYVNFLEQQSMLFQSDQEADKISGMAVQWQDDYSYPKPDQVIKQSSVWLLYYPASVITKEGTSIIGTWADPQLWTAAHTIGIDLLHTDPVERAEVIDSVYV